ncbi:hypothetical protein C5167_028586 [Papaver somniferum]|nr:hypothetical protein C5167_028586 [Papaver somniferum]
MPERIQHSKFSHDQSTAPPFIRFPGFDGSYLCTRIVDYGKGIEFHDKAGKRVELVCAQDCLENAKTGLCMELTHCREVEPEKQEPN